VLGWDSYMKIQGAIIKEQGIIFVVVIIKKYIIDNMRLKNRRMR